MAIFKLDDVLGIGSHAAGVLKTHGFTTVKKLADASLEQLASVPGFGAIRSKKIQSEAKKLLNVSGSTKPKIEVPRTEPIPAKATITEEESPMKTDKKKDPKNDKKAKKKSAKDDKSKKSGKKAKKRSAKDDKSKKSGKKVKKKSTKGDKGKKSGKKVKKKTKGTSKKKSDKKKKS